MSFQYKDSLFELSSDAIVFNFYYFPTGASRRLPLAQIESVRVKPGGCWRLWGTGDFRTWFPWDGRRPRREQVFIIIRRGKFARIGFTVERAREFATILASQGVVLTGSGG